MDGIKRISEDKLDEIISKASFIKDRMLKDYYLTVILYLIKDVKGLCFKGGTALQKIFLDYSRLSEDADFTVTRDMRDVSDEVSKILLESDFFFDVTKDKDVDGFLRLVAHYKSFSGQKDKVFIDLNKRASLILKPEIYEIKHFYEGFIPEFSLVTLSKKEMIAEKIAASIGRNRPRDTYDLYKIIKAKLPIDLKLVKKKCKLSNQDFNIIKIFNKARKLKNRWDVDMVPLLSEEISFKKVITTLSKYFKLKEVKDGKKQGFYVKKHHENHLL